MENIEDKINIKTNNIVNWGLGTSIKCDITVMLSNLIRRFYYYSRYDPSHHKYHGENDCSSCDEKDLIIKNLIDYQVCIICKTSQYLSDKLYTRCSICNYDVCDNCCIGTCCSKCIEVLVKP